MITFRALLIKWQDRRRADVVVMGEDLADFTKFAPYGALQESVRCVLDVDSGRVYPLIQTCPDDGLERWTLAAHEAVERADEAKILALSPELREKFAPGYETVDDRKARRIREDAEADARAAAAKAKAEADALAAAADLEARIQAAAAAIVEAQKP